jgi:hypothetical protein
MAIAAVSTGVVTSKMIGQALLTYSQEFPHCDLCRIPTSLFIMKTRDSIFRSCELCICKHVVKTCHTMLGLKKSNSLPQKFFCGTFSELLEFGKKDGLMHVLCVDEYAAILVARHSFRCLPTADLPIPGFLSNCWK